MKFLFYASALFLLSACAGPQDELRLARRLDGGTEIAMPYGDGVAIMESSGYPMEKRITAKAASICPNGYDLAYKGMRQRPEYADPEKVWVVTCKP